MADEKKPEAKAPAPPERDTFVELVWIFFVILILSALFSNIFNNLNANKIFANGFSGFTPKGILLSHTRPIASLSNPIGAKIVSVEDTEVYSSPGGRKIGTQRATSRGKILQGPVEIDGERYWYVDFEKGEDGWVKESDIAYLETEPSFIEKIIISFLYFWWVVRTILVIVSIIFILCIIYLYRKINEISANEQKLLYPKSPEAVSAVNPRWQGILNHLDSLNENDWKHAILEADIMLADILDRLSLPGDTIGDKLKAVEQSDFTTIDNAWEAHKIRNQIAHEGSSFILTQREAKRVVDLYKTVFEEFQII